MYREVVKVWLSIAEGLVFNCWRFGFQLLGVIKESCRSIRVAHDTLSVLEHGYDSLNNFLVFVNTFSLHLHSKLEPEYSGKLPFLDVKF